MCVESILRNIQYSHRHKNFGRNVFQPASTSNGHEDRYPRILDEKGSLAELADHPPPRTLSLKQKLITTTPVSSQGEGVSWTHSFVLMPSSSRMCNIRGPNKAWDPEGKIRSDQMAF